MLNERGFSPPSLRGEAGKEGNEKTVIKNNNNVQTFIAHVRKRPCIYLGHILVSKVCVSLTQEAPRPHTSLKPGPPDALLFCSLTRSYSLDQRPMG